MKVVVTGGLGVNGIWVVRQLLADGCEVAIFERRMDFTAAQDVKEAVRYLDIDVTDFPALSSAVEAEAPDCVVHLAAVLPDVVEAEPRTGFTVNVAGSLNVLDACRLHAVPRLVLASSRAYYGASHGPYATGSYAPIPETYVPDHPTSYGWTKVAMESIAQCYRFNYGMSVASLRFSAIYGPGRKARHGVFNLLSGMIESAYRHEPFHIESGGDQCNDYIFVEDVAGGIVASVRAPDLKYESYNISSGIKTSLRQFVDAVNEAAGGHYVTVGDGVNYYKLDKDIYGVMDNSRARESLNFTPRYSVPEGIRRYMSILAGKR
jgi:UDP-glucose 4-epimerase